MLVIPVYNFVGTLAANTVASVATPLTDANLASASLANSITMIIGQGCGRVETGTGWVVGQNLIATSAHVVVGMNKLIVGFGSDGKSNGEYARIVGFDPQTDLAILSVDTHGMPPLKLSEDSLKVQPYYSMGHPHARPLEVSPLVGVATLTHPVRGQIYQLNGNVEPGDSGSPMFDNKGEVMGVVYATINGVGAYVTPVPLVRSLLDTSRANNFLTTTDGDCSMKITS